MSCYRPTLAFSCNPTKRLSTANSLIPKQHSEITEIEIFVDEKQTALTHITVIQKDGQKTDVDIIRYETNTNFPANHFVFQKGMYPHAEIIDLR